MARRVLYTTLTLGLILLAILPAISSRIVQRDDSDDTAGGPILMSQRFSATSDQQQPVASLALQNGDLLGRDRCTSAEEANPPSNREDTTARVAALRQQLQDNNLDAYLVRLGDEHMTVGSTYEQRLYHISGYSGSAGYAIVTNDNQLVWTDGRYFTQADIEMDCNWNLMREGEPGVPTGPAWVAESLASGDNQNPGRLGITSNVVSINVVQSYQAAIEGLSDVTIVYLDEDLFDNIWDEEDRGERPNESIYEHPMDYAGETWDSKLSRTRERMVEEDVDALVITALDETAWLFNLRGSNKPTAPYFDSYAIVREDIITLYLMPGRLNDEGVADHLQVDPATGNCRTSGASNLCEEAGLTVRDGPTAYTVDIFAAVEALADEAAVSKIWLSPETCNYRVYSAAGPSEGEPDKRFEVRSPIQLMKSIKNNVESGQYKDAQIRDSSYVVRFAARLEEEVEFQGSDDWTELTASRYVTSLREEDDDFRMVSFFPISGFAEHGAVIHYRPTVETDKQITRDGMYLLDSGGNYLGATTDVTRTFHYGEPTDEEMEAYTRVLIGVIDLATTVWPQGWWGSDIDVRARASLWQHGWDYNHGTGHGIGMFLNVHEGPGSISMGFRSTLEPLHVGQFYSDEPGFYLENFFGVRLESIVTVVNASTPNQFGEDPYIGFEIVTFVPFEPKLIKFEMLDRSHRVWLNAYNKNCMEKVGPYLEIKDDDDEATRQDKERAQLWMEARVEELPTEPNWQFPTTGKASPLTSSYIVGLVLPLISLLMRL